MNNVIKRTIVTLIFVPLLITSLFLSFGNYILLFSFMIFATVIGQMEMMDLMKRKNISVNKVIFLSLTLLPPVLSYIYHLPLLQNNPYIKFYSYLFSIIIYIIYIAIMTLDILKEKLDTSFEKTGFLLIAILFPSICISFTFFILNIHVEKFDKLGSFLLLLFIFIVWANDIFAYIFGLLFGKNNIIGFSISPKKSWAGYIGGLVSACFFSSLLYFVARDYFPFHYAEILILAVILSITGDLGDLFESLLKRSCHVKDSGTIIVAMGGVLDSIDSTLFSLPLYYFLLKLFINKPF